MSAAGAGNAIRKRTRDALSERWSQEGCRVSIRRVDFKFLNPVRITQCDLHSESTADVRAPGCPVHEGSRKPGSSDLDKEARAAVRVKLFKRLHYRGIGVCIIGE